MQLQGSCTICERTFIIHEEIELIENPYRFDVCDSCFFLVDDDDEEDNCLC